MHGNTMYVSLENLVSKGVRQGRRLSVQGGARASTELQWVGGAVDGEEPGKMRWDHSLARLRGCAGSLNHTVMIHTHAERRELIQGIHTRDQNAYCWLKKLWLF